MDILSTIISLVDLYGKVSGLLKGDSSLKALERIANNIERLSDKIFYAPNIQVIQHINQSSQHSVNLREVREFLEPVQRAIGTNIVSSAMIVTPKKMQAIFKRNPWEVLDQIRPMNFAVPHSNPDMVPVLFGYNDERFIGWQMRGVLPSMFDCRYEDIWTPNSRFSKTYTANMNSGPRLYHYQSKNHYYGAYQNITFTEKDRDGTLKITVDSKNLPICLIELWRGIYNGRDSVEWTTRRTHIIRSGKQPHPNPSLTWKIEPGDYTIYFVSSNQTGKVSNEIISYQIEIS